MFFYLPVRNCTLLKPALKGVKWEFQFEVAVLQFSEAFGFIVCGRQSLHTASSKKISMFKPNGSGNSVTIAVHTEAMPPFEVKVGDVQAGPSTSIQSPKHDQISTSSQRVSNSAQHTQRPQTQANDIELGVTISAKSAVRLLEPESPHLTSKKKAMYSESANMRRFASMAKFSGSTFLRWIPYASIS